MSLLDVNDLAVHFGGVKAVDGVSFSVDPGEVFAIIGPNGAGKSTIFNLISRIYEPTRGTIRCDGQDITGLKAHDIAQLGIARTFQNIELFDHSTVLANLLMGRHTHKSTNFVQDILFLPKVRREEREHRHRVEEVIEPERTIPRAIIVTLGLTAALYISVSIVAIGSVGGERFAAAAGGRAAPPAVRTPGALESHRCHR